MSGEKTGRVLERDGMLEEEDARARSVKKPKGLGALEDEAMDDEMRDLCQSVEAEDCGAISPPVRGGPIQEREKGRKIVSYRDKVLCLNGDEGASDSEDEDWMQQQKREEEEEDIPDETRPTGEENPIFPTYVFSRKQHKEDTVKWRNALIIKLMGKKIVPRYLMNRLQKLWSMIGGYKLIDMENGYSIIKFNEEMDYLHVLHEGPWIVADHYVIV